MAKRFYTNVVQPPTDINAAAVQLIDTGNHEGQFFRLQVQNLGPYPVKIGDDADSASQNWRIEPNERVSFDLQFPIRLLVKTDQDGQTSEVRYAIYPYSPTAVESE